MRAATGPAMREASSTVFVGPVLRLVELGAGDTDGGYTPFQAGER